MNLPVNHQSIIPYLILKDTSEFFDFTNKVFDAEKGSREILREDGTVMHAEIIISGNTIMITDENKDWPSQTAHLFVYVPDVDGTYQKALNNGAKNVMDVTTKNSRTACGVVDPFGNVWWISSVQ
ncbi:VOC family protein [Flavobacterium sp. N2038]|jgi:PhnB protein|uniref:VOC family protein n=1 Tax=Flavobacterium sp. N2038 TaxID=2986829 RepID=UPI0022250052|nr:VOC family protein [Flavobacterium sp. N2038]